MPPPKLHPPTISLLRPCADECNQLQFCSVPPWEPTAAVGKHDHVTGEPPAYLRAISRRIDAMLSAIKNVRPVIADFYTSLSAVEQSIATVRLKGWGPWRSRSVSNSGNLNR
jgi:hypothetical protein